MVLDLQYWATVIMQLLVATICGGLIGYQREASERPAGFRTHVLVCVGSAIYMLVSVAVAGDRFDPARIAAQVASGIGFLGAGTIIKQGSIVRGLTTAASLWAVAGVGLAAGYGGKALAIALIGTIVVFFALTVLGQFERRIERARRRYNISITLVNPRERVAWVQEVLGLHEMTILNLRVNGTSELGEINVDGRAPTQDDIERVLAELAQGEGVHNIEQHGR